MVILCVTVIGCIFLWLLDVRRRKRMFMNQMDEIGQSRDILDDTKSRFSDNIRELVGKYLHPRPKRFIDALPQNSRIFRPKRFAT